MRSKKKIKTKPDIWLSVGNLYIRFCFWAKNQDGKVSIKICRSDGDTLSMTRQDARILSIAIGAVIELWDREAIVCCAQLPVKYHCL